MKRYLPLFAFIACGLAAEASAQVALRQSDAIELVIGPLVDSTDGVTAETALTISQADVTLTKCAAAGDCAASAQKNDASSCAHVTNGLYECDFNTTDTDTIGVLRIDVQESGAAPWFGTFVVVEEAVYDACCSGSAVPLTKTDIIDEFETQSQADPTGFHVNVKEVNGTPQTAKDIGALNVTNVNTLAGHDPGEAIMGTTDLGTGSALTSLASAANMSTLLTNVDALPTNAELTTALDALAAAGVNTLGFKNSAGDACTLTITEAEPHLTLVCVEAP